MSVKILIIVLLGRYWLNWQGWTGVFVTAALVDGRVACIHLIRLLLIAFIQSHWWCVYMHCVVAECAGVVDGSWDAWQSASFQLWVQVLSSYTRLFMQSQVCRCLIDECLLFADCIYPFSTSHPQSTGACAILCNKQHPEILAPLFRSDSGLGSCARWSGNLYLIPRHRTPVIIATVFWPSTCARSGHSHIHHPVRLSLPICVPKSLK